MNNKILGLLSAGVFFTSTTVCRAVTEPIRTTGSSGQSHTITSPNVSHPAVRSNPLFTAKDLSRLDASRTNIAKSELKNFTIVGRDELVQTSASTPAPSQSQSNSTSSTTNPGFTRTPEANLKKLFNELPQVGKEFNKIIENKKVWDKWTKDTGKLTIERIGQLLQDPNIKGKEAAVLGALADFYYMGGSDNQPYTQAALTEIGADPTGSNNNATLIADFATADKQIEQDTLGKDGYTLYGNHNPPTENDIIQWNACDCYFLSTVNALIHQNPQAIPSMITQVKPDVFQVKFPGYPQPVTVTLTDGEIAMFSHSRDGGCFLPVLGMAAAKVMEAKGDPLKSDAALTGSITATPLGPLVGTGGGWVEVNMFQLFTGADYAEHELDNYTTKQLGNVLERALANHELVGLNSGKDSHYIGTHYLCVLDYDPKTGMVTIKNPWGQNMEYYPKFPAKQTFLFDSPKDEQGFDMKEGVFKCSLSQLKEYFGRITLQKSTDTSTAQNTESTQSTTSTTGGHAVVESPPDASATNAAQGTNNVALSSPLSLSQGSAFLAHNNSVTLQSENGIVQAEPRALAFVVRLGTNLAVYNIGEVSDGQVRVDTGNNDTVAVKPGHALVLSPDQTATFENANPLPSIGLSDLTDLGVHNGQKVFDGKVPLMQVLDNSPQFEDLVNSQRKEDQTVVNKLLKNMAAQAAVSN